jgi:biopolymer transport protein ExbD
MSANFGSGGGNQEVELNITPIIDCFTVLITFMLASASFLSIGFFEAATPGNSSDPTAEQPDVEAVVRIKANHMAELKIKGKKNLTVSYDLKNAEALKGLDQEITKLTSEHLKLNQVLLSADDDVDYKSVSELMSHLSLSKLPVVVGDF